MNGKLKKKSCESIVAQEFKILAPWGTARQKLTEANATSVFYYSGHPNKQFFHCFFLNSVEPGYEHMTVQGWYNTISNTNTSFNQPQDSRTAEQLNCQS